MRISGTFWSCLWLLIALAVTPYSAQRDTVRLKQVFSKNNWNNYGVGSALDVLRDFRALMTGCTGAIRAGRPCSMTPNNVKVTMDPAGSNNKVMSVLYRRGAYATHGGSQWYTESSAIMAKNQGMLEYDVYFQRGFDFHKGGKLPGFFGGNYMCSGSKVTPDGRNCFSARIMWRPNGMGETYFYLPITRQQPHVCARCAFWPPRPSCRMLRSRDFCSWNRGAFTFPRGQWTKVQQYIKLNTPGRNNGKYQLYINRQLVMSSDDIFYRSTERLKLKGMLFSTFMGGDDPSWAPRRNQWAYFRNIRLYAPQ